MSQTTSDAEQLVRDYTEMWNERDTARISDLVSESFVVYNPVIPNGEAHGRDGLEEWMRQVTSGFPDFHVEVEEVLAGEETAMAEVAYTATHEGEFGGIAPTDRSVELGGMVKINIEDGKVREHRDYVDRQELFEQLGVTPE